MGWAMLLALAAASFGALALLGIGRRLWSFAGAALMLGAAGYALQGRPLQPASPARPIAAVATVDPAIIDLRDSMLGRFYSDTAYLVAADAMTRSGDPRAAVQVILGGIRAQPRSLALWTGLGTAYAAHDGDQVSPPALFAFQQAMRLAPEHPAPPFFLGLAYVRAGDFRGARPWWARALALSPVKGASYRQGIAVRLELLDRYLAASGQN